MPHRVDVLQIVLSRVFIVFLLASMGAQPTLAQDTDTTASTSENTPATSTQAALTVFVDCQTRECDFNHFRREIPYVSYVRNRQDAEVHVLVTTQDVASGGTAFTFDFIGRERFDDIDATLTYTSTQTSTDARILEGLTRHLAAGLMRYVAETPAFEQVDISSQAASSAQPRAAPADDPWNLWVFDVGIDGSIEGEQRSSERSFRGSADASRTSNLWKIDLDFDADFEEEEFEVNDSTTVTNSQRDSDFETLLVRSLTNHWSIGGFSEIGRSTFNNFNLRAVAAPAIEYNVFPYAESTRRQVLFLYRVSVNRFDYQEETIFDKTSETLLQQSLNISAEIQQPWGSIQGSIEGSHFLHDFSRKRLELFTNIELNVYRGLSLDLFGDLSLIRDQINLRKGDADQEDVLLRRRELATDFEFSLSIGISYTFGATTNNVVNPRFGD